MGDGHKRGVYFPPLNGFCNWQWMSDISHEGTDPWREEELGSSSDGPELTSSPALSLQWSVNHFLCGWGGGESTLQTTFITPKGNLKKNQSRKEKEENTLKLEGQPETQSCHYLHLQWLTMWGVGTPSPEILPEERSIHNPHWMPQLLRPAPKRRVPKISSF